VNAARQYRFWLIGIGVALVALYLLRGVMLPFVAGMAIAYFLDPLCDRLERWGCPRTLATTIVLIGFTVLAVAILLLVIPLVEAQAAELAKDLPGLVATLQARLEPFWQIVFQYLSADEIAQLRVMLGEQAGGIVRWLPSALGGVLSNGLALVNLLSLVFITPVVTFYLLRDWDHLVARVDSWIPREHLEVVREQARLIDHTLAGFARGQATVCLVLGVFYALGLTVVGLEFGLVVGLIAGILSFVPYVGTITGFVTSMGLAFVQFSDPLSIGLVFGVFLIGQVLEGQFLTPKLVGDRIGLHPVWVIFALLAGGTLFGFVGVLLGLPVAAVVGVLARFGLSRYEQSPYYRSGSSPKGVPVSDSVVAPRDLPSPD